jgi:hypothetical protein
LSHYFFFAMNQEGSRRVDFALPGKQLRLVGMGRKSVDRKQARMHGNLFAEQMHYVGTVDNLARERASRGKSDENYAGVLTP